MAKGRTPQTIRQQARQQTRRGVRPRAGATGVGREARTRAQEATIGASAGRRRARLAEAVRGAGAGP